MNQNSRGLEISYKQIAHLIDVVNDAHRREFRLHCARLFGKDWSRALKESSPYIGAPEEK